MRLLISRLAFLLAAASFFFLAALLVVGFPPVIAGHEIHLKNIRKPFLWMASLILAGFVFHPERKVKAQAWKERITAFASRPYAVWLLAGLYGILFLWQQLTEYFSIDINFIPFGFYDYMLHYFWKGKIYFTGFLHGYYHFNNILFLLAPLWRVFQTPLFLCSIYGFLASLAAVPLWAIAKERFREPVAPLFIAFIYLNYRYLQNVLLMNFSVEIFYPLFFFAALHAALKRFWPAYYFFVLLGLAVKEDSFLYLSALGLVVLFLSGGKRHGLATVGLSIVYFIFLVKVLAPWSGNPILKEDLNNFEGHGSSLTEIAGNILKNPFMIPTVLFGSVAKLRTWFNLLSRLAFLPLASPAAVLIAAPIFPLFFHHTGRDADFVDLRFHYAAAVLPFVFTAFVFGFSNLYHKMKGVWRERFLWGVCLGLVFVNGGHFVTRRVTAENLESISWVKKVPVVANLVTQGHLLPYMGYRERNYYFALPFELKENEGHEAYANADHYLIDFNVNFYPMDRAYFEGKVRALMADGRYELAAQENGRYLFKRK